MKVCQNRATKEYFIYIERNGNGKGIFVTPKCEVKSLKSDLFFSPEEGGEDYFLSRGLVTENQIEKYREEISWRKNFDKKQESAERWRKFEAMTNKEKVHLITTKLSPIALEMLAEELGCEVNAI